ncbi:hypothetical protein AVEN_45072-1 [Araneus ventricosus]|uniref:Uncharacterized protein n=1 Tax=Araneus ventricosus TaxID=182803 RepID=A0A4Y2RSG6_ARAVE|nr:hypothetical protein AVEN_45072-1 [Araneus ventricosus]
MCYYSTLALILSRSILVVWSQLRDRRVSDSKLNSTEDLPCMGLVGRLIIHSGRTVILLLWCGKLEKGVPVQVSFSSSDRGSKFSRFVPK